MIATSERLLFDTQLNAPMPVESPKTIEQDGVTRSPEWDWSQVAKIWNERKPIANFFQDPAGFLSWGLDPTVVADLSQSSDADLLSGMNRFETLSSSMQGMFTTASDVGALDFRGVIEGLQFAYSLQSHANEAGIEVFCRQLARSFQRPRLLSDSSDLLVRHCVLELHLLVMYQFPSQFDAHQIENLVLAWEDMVDEVVDGDGWISAEHVTRFWALAASWSRCFAIAKTSKWDLPEAFASQLEWVARQFLRTMAPNGSQMLGSTEPASEAFQAAVVQMSTDRVDRKLSLLRDPKQKSKKKDDINLTLFDDGSFSEWAATGVFQAGWGSHSPRMMLASQGSQTQIQVANQVDLIRGTDQWDLRYNGETVGLYNCDHEINCQYSDEQIEFIEFELRLDQGITLQRQYVFLVEDQLLLLADVMMCPQPGSIEFTRRLPLADAIEFMPEVETREGYLKNGNTIQSLVIPLSAGEWQKDHTATCFEIEDRKLVFRQTVTGSAHYSAMVMDLSPKRSKRPRTWRRLTIAENMESVAHDKGAAFRIQIGKEQWLLYQSLSGSANRTFLGENHICEFFIGRTDGESQSEELLQVE